MVPFGGGRQACAVAIGGPVVGAGGSVNSPGGGRRHEPLGTVGPWWPASCGAVGRSLAPRGVVGGLLGGGRRREVPFIP